MGELTLKPEVAAKYEMLKGFGVGEYHWRGRVLLQHVTLEKADQLVEAGFPYLVLKEAKGERLKVKGKAEKTAESYQPGGDVNSSNTEMPSA